MGFVSSRAIRFIMAFMFILSLSSCFSNQLAGNDNGSEPVNESESVEYKKALLRCYKTGGTRVVKITGQLRCY